MFRSVAAVLAASAAVTLAACGSDEQSGGVSPEAAKARIERAAHLTLASEPVPSEARDEGLLATYSNAGTAAKDRQVVGVFVMKDVKVAGKVSDMVRGSAPKSAKLLVNGEVMVVYAAAGTDHAAAVKRAVDAL